jgi:hypothetical protein
VSVIGGAIRFTSDGHRCTLLAASHCIILSSIPFQGKFNGYTARPLKKMKERKNKVNKILDPRKEAAAEKMLEELVATLLARVLGTFVSGIDGSTLRLSAWRGEVRLAKLQLRRSALDVLALPVRSSPRPCSTTQENSQKRTFAAGAISPLSRSHPSHPHPWTRGVVLESSCTLPGARAAR